MASGLASLKVDRLWLPDGGQESDSKIGLVIVIFIIFSCVIAYLLYLKYKPHEGRISKSIRDGLPISTFKSFEETPILHDLRGCRICQEDEFLPEERVINIPSCGHAFHYECLSRWIDQDSRCPLDMTCIRLEPPPVDV